ncbi:MAG: peptide chain release factor N(5)-glutamine methyltransferase [Phycisphaerales bacterium]
MPAPPKTWTTRDLLAWMTKAFEDKDLDSPRRLAEELLAHVVGCERLRLYMDADRPASELERAQLRDLVKRALAHEPVQYLIGHESFYGVKLNVDPRVLIPRPSTQTIVDATLAHFKADPRVSSVRESDAGAGSLIADICTGSGCVAIALAKHLPGARFVATDVSADALAVAQENCETIGVDDRVELLEGDLLAALDAHPVARSAGSLAALVSNPPYIPDDEWADVEPNVKDHEPTGALRGGADGMDLARPLIERAPERLAPGGLLAIEIAAVRAPDALELARTHSLLEGEKILKDSDGLDRVLVATRKR